MRRRLRPAARPRSARRPSASSSTTCTRSRAGSANHGTRSCSTTRLRVGAAPALGAGHRRRPPELGFADRIAAWRGPGSSPELSTTHGYDDRTMDAPTRVLAPPADGQRRCLRAATGTPESWVEPMTVADDGYVALQHRPSHVVVVLTRRADPWRAARSPNRSTTSRSRSLTAPRCGGGPIISPTSGSTTPASSSSSASRRCSSATPTASPSSSSRRRGT